MYDRLFAEKTLNSEDMRNKAIQEVEFLVTVLKLSAGAKILDVPCGTGRHSHLLADKGFNVTGVDINPDCLAIANKENIPGFKAYLGNMQDLSSYKNFDCTLNLFTSFGYFATDEENENVLKEMVRTLKPGGKLVMNLINRLWLMSIYQPAFWVRRNDVLLINASKFDPKTNYNETYITAKDEATGEATVSYHRSRLYAPSEIVELMKRAGLKDIKVYGDYLNAPFNENTSTHPFYVGTV